MGKKRLQRVRTQSVTAKKQQSATLGRVQQQQIKTYQKARDRQIVEPISNQKSFEQDIITG